MRPGAKKRRFIARAVTMSPPKPANSRNARGKSRIHAGRADCVDAGHL